ncbi:uncharacterized protein [Prorops nasuta]|uniref:uncharacterized protein n=1 Tax=Prorops nasuta TaxID=863751 RepID=UPI0034CD915A
MEDTVREKFRFFDSEAKEKLEEATIPMDSTVRSQDSKDSKDSSNADSKPDSCLESKHSKEVLISERERTGERRKISRQRRPIAHQENRKELQNSTGVKDDTNFLMFTSCGQLLLGVVLVVFGVLVLVHGASLGGSGAGLWAGAGALIAGALGVVATLATSTSKPNSGFASAHLASSLVALALSNMAAITALTAVVRDSQRTQELTLLAIPGEDGNVVEVESGWAGLLASIGLLVASVAELLVSGYTCVTLTPKICGCLKSSRDGENYEDDEASSASKLKTRNMVHQWVIAQNHGPKNQPIYVVQPVLPMHPMMQGPYGMPAPPPPGFIPAGTLPMPTAHYGPMPMIPHMPYGPRSSSQMMRQKQKRHLSSDHGSSMEGRGKESKSEASRRMDSIGEDQIDLTQTYTGLDKRISEEFISIAMDPDRKSKASSNHGSDLGTVKNS